MSNVHVRVTEAHINQGRVCPIRHGCPIKKALEDVGFPDATVGPTTVWIDGMSGDRFAALPKHAEKFLHAFDHGLPVAPFSFDLDVRAVVHV